MKHILSGILGDRHRRIIHSVVEEISVSPSEDSIIDQLMPITDVPAGVLEHETISGSGGMTQERALDAEGKEIPGQSSTSVLYKPGSYQESIIYRESDLLKLRKYGTLGERGATGLTGGELDHMERGGKKLSVRLKNRAHYLRWEAIFNDRFVWQGVTKTFGRPSANVITAATDWSVANTGKPFEDLITILNTNPVVRKYRNMIKALVINPKTEADIMKRALESGYITNANIQSAGINKVREFSAPGLPPFEVVADAYQSESYDPETQLITLGDAEYLVPDNKVLLVIDFDQSGALYSQYGELQLTENMNDPSATIQSPAVGMYTFIDEKGLERRKNPFVELVAGFNGGPNLMRPDDVIVIGY